MKSFLPILWIATLALTGCAPAPPLPEPIEPGPDPHSFSNHEQVRVEHLVLDLGVDFDRRRLAGYAELHLNAERSTDRLVLDTRGLEIVDVNSSDATGALEPLSWRLAGAIDERPWMGRALVIALRPDVERVRVDYRTAPEAYGLQWLNEQQTASGQPFLFSQSQPVFARTWVPLQDTPAVRYTFEARLQVPRNLMAVMGAAGNPVALAADGRYAFEMPQPIPSYLMALAVGQLEFKATGPRSGVYAEPSLLEAAADEFAELEEMIDAGEDLYGPYRWDRYDLLILPPSFPFGGMENPRLSFITPTVIAGDRSLTALIAHELAHSWSGNLVTNTGWQELWLNEGFTTYFESRIVETLYGPERATAEAALETAGLIETFKDMPSDQQVLVRPLDGADPENAFTSVPYDKGRLFLYWLESALGREQLDRFLSDYFDRFAFESIDTEDFLRYAEEHLVVPNTDRIDMEQIRTWLYAPGLPEFAELPSSNAFDRVDQWRARWLAGDTSAENLPSDDWSVSQWRHFLTGLSGEVDADAMAALDKAFELTASRNVEILFLWLERSIETRYAPGIERLESFLVEVGRNKFTRPLYEALAETDWGRERALAIYRQARPGYHPMTRQAAERALGIDGAGEFR